MNELTIKSLLRQVLDTKSEYDKKAESTGERFNVFRILEVTSDEVRLHSRLLGELLNPKGSHGRGDVFLKLFLNLIKSKSDIFTPQLTRFNTAIAIVKIEYHIPAYISSDKLEGGRIDIKIESGQENIIIENKIYAGDQYNQLIRYYNFDRTAPLIYLTLDGKEPSEFSCRDDKSSIHLKSNEHFQCLSYKQDIVTWLKECIKETEKLPIVKETIQQYIHLINSLTFQTNYEKMNEELVKTILETDEHIEAAFLIANIKDDFIYARSKLVSDKVIEEILRKYPTIKVSSDYNTLPRLEFYPEKWNNHLIGFTDDGGLSCGIKRVLDRTVTLKYEDIKDRVDKSWKTYPWWLCYKRMDEPRLNLSTPEPWLKRNEEIVVKSIVDQVYMFIRSMNQLPPEKQTLL